MVSKWGMGWTQLVTKTYMWVILVNNLFQWTVDKCIAVLTMIVVTL